MSDHMLTTTPTKTAAFPPQGCVPITFIQTEHQICILQDTIWKMITQTGFYKSNLPASYISAFCAFGRSVRTFLNGAFACERKFPQAISYFLKNLVINKLEN